MRTISTLVGLFFAILANNLSAGEWVLHSMDPALAAEGEKTDDGGLTLTASDHEGITGYWENTFPVEGGKWYRFGTKRKAAGIAYPRRSCVVRVEWSGSGGRAVTSQEPVNTTYFGDVSTMARPEFPRDQETTADGWTCIEDTYRAPLDATNVVVQLHLRWAPGGEVQWAEPAISLTEKPAKREVTLASVHTALSGSGRTVAENREHFRPLIAEAANRGADLVVLPELLTCKGVSHDYCSLAEPVPGPTTGFFGELAKEHDTYLVVGLPEKSGDIVYNTAVLLGSDGSVVGKYRKVTLPQEEIARGISPGNEYPVFETRFGKVGLMICYDVFYPEVARELAMNGAEVIAVPIWGGNPALAAARCIENGVYLVTSTYTSHENQWMKSAVWNREGDRMVTAEEWESVVLATVDLNERTFWHGLGDFQARVQRESPVRQAETRAVGDAVDVGSGNR
jgi:predicted amidohydrolase